MICAVMQVVSLPTLLKNNNHYITGVKINKNEGYFYLKWRDKFTVSNIWHEIQASMCQIFIFAVP